MYDRSTPDADDEQETCRDCGRPIEDAEGWDGRCGTCADRAEIAAWRIAGTQMLLCRDCQAEAEEKSPGTQFEPLEPHEVRESIYISGRRAFCARCNAALLALVGR